MTEKKRRALFVTHNFGLYGASKSLQLLLKNNSEIDVTLIIPAKGILTESKRKIVADRFGIGCNLIKQFFLPWSNCFECRKINFTGNLLEKVKNILWKINKSQFYKFIENGHYDYVHLNSLVLNDIIIDKYPFILHIREYLIDYAEKVIPKIKKSKGVIFIDESIKKPFEHVELDNEITLSNPIDMRDVSKHGNMESIHADKAVISLIGRIEQDKGIEFIIKSFKSSLCQGMQLIIVGNEGDGISTGYQNYCQDMSEGDKRIVFWGFENDIHKIYAMSDYIIRGEIDFRMGRSILEALYSDCEVILPISNQKILDSNPELSKFKNKIHAYVPRNLESLNKLLLALDRRKVRKKRFHSNIKEYIKDFNEYIDDILSVRNTIN